MDVPSRSVPETFRAAADALSRDDFEAAIRVCAPLVVSDRTPSAADLAFHLCYARRRYRSARRAATVRLAVCGWDLSHNAAGRVRALADLHAEHVETEIVGTLFNDWGGALWEPIRGGAHPIHPIRVTKSERFLSQALDLVLAHPYDVVHLSKPRMPNVIYGLLYKMIWGAHIVMDIDDEELAFTGTDAPLPLTALGRAGTPDWTCLRRPEWTRAAVGLAGMFDAVTVSNVALQRRYGGCLVPHARFAAPFRAAALRSRALRRAQLGIPDSAFVVLFLGTPRRHKGVLETARALASLGREDVHFLIVGDFDDLALRREIEAISGLKRHLVPNQPFSHLAELVTLGDACVLLQDGESLVSKFQFPAKLVDALAAGLITFATPTEPLRPLIRDGAVIAVAEDTLPRQIATFLSDPEARARQSRRGRDWFDAHLSVEACSPSLAELVFQPPELPAPDVLLDDRQQAEAAHFLGLAGPAPRHDRADRSPSIASGRITPSIRTHA